MHKNTWKRIKTYCEEQTLLAKGDGVVIGLSGGADSVFLLYALAKMRQEWELNLCAVHINHGIRGEEALRDEQAAKRQAEKLHIPCYCFTEDIPALAKKRGVSEEEAGRAFRYECFERVRVQQQFQKIAVAHHEDDQAETVMWQLLRGSGIRGAGGIRPKRDQIIRPLLCVTKQEIVTALREEGISWVEDTTNQSCDYTRNKIRNELFPWLEEQLQPMAKKHLAEFAGDCRLLWEYLEEQAAGVYDKAVMHTPDGKTGISIKDLQKEHPAIRQRVLQQMLEQTAGVRKDLGRVHVEQLCSLMQGLSGHKSEFPYEITAWKEGTVLWMKQGKDAVQTLPMCPITFRCVPRAELPQSVPKNNCTKWFDCDRMYADALVVNMRFGEISLQQLPLQWRFPMEGDYMILSASGGRKKLSRIFIDEKIGISQRSWIPVLAMEHHIIWVPQIGRSSAGYYVTEETKHVLVGELPLSGKP